MPLTQGRVVMASVLVFLLLVVGATSCGSDGSEGRTEADGALPFEPSSASSPFTVGAPPDGFTLVAGGRGTRVQEWGSDTVGTDSPYAVVRRTGRSRW